MTVEDIRKDLDCLRGMRHDDEAAHAYEDQMRTDVLLAIAEGRCEDPAACAAEVLKSSEIMFARWCA